MFLSSWPRSTWAKEYAERFLSSALRRLKNYDGDIVSVWSDEYIIKKSWTQRRVKHVHILRLHWASVRLLRALHRRIYCTFQDGELCQASWQRWRAQVTRKLRTDSPQRARRRHILGLGEIKSLKKHSNQQISSVRRRASSRGWLPSLSTTLKLI